MKAENRLQALCMAFGQQGGTIHQMAEKTGCNAFDLLNAKSSRMWIGSDYSDGFEAKACSPEFNRKFAFSKRKGNLEYWLGVIDSFMID